MLIVSKLFTFQLPGFYIYYNVSYHRASLVGHVGIVYENEKLMEIG